MSFIAVVSDSTPGLSEAYVERHNIRIVPLYLKIGDKTYRDGVDMTSEEFYRILPSTSPLPTTSQPSAGDFEVVYRALAAEGAEGIISIHISSGISGTVNSAHIAADAVGDVPITIVDTLYAAGLHTLIVEAIVSALDEGADMAGAVAAGQQVIDQGNMLFVVDTLEYLYKGGRIGGAAALLGSVLQFKPLLYLKDGRIDALERVRTSLRALTRTIDIMGEWMGRDTPLEAVVMHANCLERAQALAEHLPKTLNVDHVRITYIPPVLGAHVGPGTVGLCCCPKAVSGSKLDDSAI